MVEIGGKPILWHIMKTYSSQGFNDFIICLGYKGYQIKEYFLHYYLHNSDLTIELHNNVVDVHSTDSESFKVTLIDTGLHTKTAGRLNRVKEFLDGSDFMLTYGDGVCDVNVKSLIDFHKSHDKIATVSVIQPEARFGGMDLSEDHAVLNFKEKPKEDSKWINAGYFVLKNEVFDYLKQTDIDQIMWEDYPMEQLARDKELMAYKHTGFWKCMDAMRDKIELENIWENGKAPWKIWP